MVGRLSALDGKLQFDSESVSPVAGDRHVAPAPPTRCWPNSPQIGTSRMSACGMVGSSCASGQIEQTDPRIRERVAAAQADVWAFSRPSTALGFLQRASIAL